MLYRKILSVALFAVTLGSCSQATETTSASETAPVQATQALAFETRTLTRSSENCATDSSRCATVSIAYPEVVAGPAPLRQSINQYMQQRLRSMALDFNPDADTSGQKDAAAFLADFFLGQHQQLLQELANGTTLPASMARWELEVQGEPLLVSDQVTSLQAETYCYTGGAHPNHYQLLQTFTSEGEVLSLRDMVTDTTALMKLAEQEFRKVKELGDMPLSEAGLFIDDENLPMPQNAALTPKGLLLYYNPYEIGPWAFGETSLLLSYAQLNDILLPKYKPEV